MDRSHHLVACPCSNVVLLLVPFLPPLSPGVLVTEHPGMRESSHHPLIRTSQHICQRLIYSTSKNYCIEGIKAIYWKCVQQNGVLIKKLFERANFVGIIQKLGTMCHSNSNSMALQEG